MVATHGAAATRAITTSPLPILATAPVCKAVGPSPIRVASRFAICRPAGAIISSALLAATAGVAPFTIGHPGTTSRKAGSANAGATDPERAASPPPTGGRAIAFRGRGGAAGSAGAAPVSIGATAVVAIAPEPRTAAGGLGGGRRGGCGGDAGRATGKDVSAPVGVPVAHPVPSRAGSNGTPLA